MTRSFVIIVAALASVAMLAPATASAKWGKKCKKQKKQWEKVCVPGWIQGNYFQVQVPAKLAEVLLKKGGAIETGEYWRDFDGDGFGDADAKVRPCPKKWRADNNADCDDGNADVHPDAEELCGDDVDENCNGEVDEGCSSGVACPCFTAEEIGAAHASFTSTQWDSSTLTCEDHYAGDDTWHWDYAELTWAGSLTADGQTESQSARFYGLDYVDGAAGTLCIKYVTEIGAEYYEDYVEFPLSAEEHEVCMDTILQFADSAGIQCMVTP